MLLTGIVIGAVLTWLVMSGLLKIIFNALTGRFWSANLENREVSTEQWLFNTPQHPHSNWGIIGYWKDARNYERACVEMAGLLADRACLSSSDDVIDVNFNSADQLLVWADYYQVRSLRAFSPHYWHQENARKRCAQFAQVELLKGAEKNIASLESASADKVLALDYGYFIEDKAQFLKECRRVLRPGGCYGANEIVLIRPLVGRWEHFVMRTMLRLLKIPLSSFITQSDYEAMLQEQGFSELSISDISDDVLPGFMHWQQQHYQSLQDFTGRQVWFRSRLLAIFLRWLLMKDLLRYLLVAAK